MESKRQAAIVESSDDAIVGKDLNGVVTSWNSGAERLFGYTAEEMIGTEISRLIPSERPDEEPAILARLRRGEFIDHYETVRLTKDGNRINVSLTVSPIFDRGKVIGASKIARDITQKKRAEESARNCWLANMSRELKPSRQPRQGRIPGDSFARTAHAAHGNARLVNDAAQWAWMRKRRNTRSIQWNATRGHRPADRRSGRCPNCGGNYNSTCSRSICRH